MTETITKTTKCPACWRTFTPRVHRAGEMSHATLTGGIIRYVKDWAEPCPHCVRCAKVKDGRP